MMQDKRQQILDTALSLFTKQGLQQTSVGQISKESGVAVGTIYHHFSSKDDIINAIFLSIEENLGQAVAFTPEECTLSIRQRFEILWKKAFYFYQNHPEQFIFQDTHNYSPLISNQTRIEGRKHYQQAIDFICEAVAAEVFVPMPLILLIRWYYNSVVTLIQIQLTQEVEVTEQMIEDAIQLTWKSMTR